MSNVNAHDFFLSEYPRPFAMGRSLLLSRRHLFGPPLNLEFGHVT